MRVIIGTTEEVGALAARSAHAALRGTSRPVIGFATGSSPLPLYRAWASDPGERKRMRTARGFALDEYVGLPAGHPQSYRSVISREVEEPLGLAPGTVAVPDGTANDVVAAAARYEALIAQSGGVDLQVLGLGSNGHIGFNEPFSSLASRTREVVLAESTRRDNARYFGMEEVPRTAITQGLATILESRRILVIATGRSKSEAAAAVIEGAVSAKWPGSVLQFHEHVDVVLDEEAASRLQGADYYRAAVNWTILTLGAGSGSTLRA